MDSDKSSTISFSADDNDLIAMLWREYRTGSNSVMLNWRTLIHMSQGEPPGTCFDSLGSSYQDTAIESFRFLYKKPHAYGMVNFAAWLAIKLGYSQCLEILGWPGGDNMLLFGGCFSQLNRFLAASIPNFDYDYLTALPSLFKCSTVFSSLRVSLSFSQNSLRTVHIKVGPY